MSYRGPYCTVEVRYCMYCVRGPKPSNCIDVPVLLRTVTKDSRGQSNVAVSCGVRNPSVVRVGFGTGQRPINMNRQAAVSTRWTFAYSLIWECGM